MIFRRKKREQTLAQIVSHYKAVRGTRKLLPKKELEIEIDGQKFEFIDMPLKEKDGEQPK